MSDELDSPEDPGRLLDRFVDNLPGVAYRCDPEPPWEMAFLRGRVEELTGYDATAFERGDVSYGDLVLEADGDALEGTVEAAVADGTQFSETYRIKTRSGQVKHVFERGVPTYTDGSVTALEGIIIDVTERKTYERRLERQNDLFAETQELADVGGWEMYPEDERLEWTEQVKHIHGVDPEASPDIEDAIEFYHPDDRPTIREAVNSAITDGEAFEHELRVVTDDDELRWVRVTGSPEVERGRVVRVRGAIQDITAERERLQSLREAEAFTRSIFQALPDALYAFNENLELQRWNDKLRSATGYTDEEIAEMRPMDFVAEPDRERVREHVATVIEDGEPTTVEARLLTKDGDRIPYEFTGAPLRDDDDRLRGLVGIGRDLSGRRERQRRFEAAFNNTYQFTGLVRPDGTIIEINDAGLEFAGVTRQEARGLKIWEASQFSHGATRETVREGVERALDGEFFREEIRLKGEQRDAVIDFSIRPITDEDGEIILLVPEGRDITAIKDRERLLGMLHRLLRHNLRNDLTGIRGYAEMLAAELGDDEALGYAERIEAAADDLLSTSETAKRIVDLILDQGADAGRSDVGEIAERAVDRVRERYPEATVDVTIEDALVAACDLRIDAAVEQLVENGVEHNLSASPTVQVSVYADDGDACIEVVDDGVGMPEEEWTMVDVEVGDDPTQLRHGSGMGLLLARWTVDEVGGTLEYRCRADEAGSVFTVRLPTE